ncbi:ecdysone oxidase-like [Adelges cooleyi]|uniref:ecdysone oxidase-like n=1 Tax=Adelges cooleyi TaxID=133065 RepID=UPI00217FB9F4|nr:ecdysone oxidase-like [Adelges cooleyi]
MATIRISCLLTGLLAVFLGTEVHAFGLGKLMSKNDKATTSTTTRSVTTVTTTTVFSKNIWASKNLSKSININMQDVCYKLGYNLEGQYVVPEFLKLLDSLNKAQVSMASEIVYPRDYSMSLQDGERVDVIVLGSGAGGSLLAAKLSDNKDLNVLLIEAGDKPPLTSEIPALWAGFANTKMEWNYRAQEDETFGQGLDGRRAKVIRGLCVGGTTAVSPMLYDRGILADYLALEAAGLTKWGWKTVMHLYKRSEDCRFETITSDKTIKQSHSLGGKVVVDSFRNRLTVDIRKCYDKALAPEHYSLLDFATVKSHLGFFSSVAMVKDGMRLNAARAALSDAGRKYNLRVAAKTTAKRLLFEGNRVTGVLVENSAGETITVKADKGVVVCAGPVGTPQLLVQSGVGPKNLLGSLGIPEVAVNERVGLNLQAHPTFLGLLVAFDSPPLKPYSISEMVFEYLMKKSGPLSNIGMTSFTGFIDVDKDGHPDVQIHLYYYSQEDTVVMPAQLDAFNFNEHVVEQIVKFNEEKAVQLIGISLMRPTNTGCVTIEKTECGYEPVIKYGSLSEEDVTTILKAIEWIKKLTAAEAFVKYGPKIQLLDFKGGPTPNVDCEQYWRHAIKHLTTMNVQMAGTSSMGLDASNGVVDQDLRVFGTESLWVADSSVLTKLFSGESCAPTMMVAEKANDLIKEHLGCKYKEEDSEEDPKEDDSSEECKK